MELAAAATTTTTTTTTSSSVTVISYRHHRHRHQQQQQQRTTQRAATQHHNTALRIKTGGGRQLRHQLWLKQGQLFSLLSYSPSPCLSALDNARPQLPCGSSKQRTIDTTKSSRDARPYAAGCQLGRKPRQKKNKNKNPNAARGEFARSGPRFQKCGQVRGWSNKSAICAHILGSSICCRPLLLIGLACTLSPRCSLISLSPSLWISDLTYPASRYLSGGGRNHSRKNNHRSRPLSPYTGHP